MVDQLTKSGDVQGSGGAIELLFRPRKCRRRLLLNGQCNLTWVLIHFVHKWGREGLGLYVSLLGYL